MSPTPMQNDIVEAEEGEIVEQSTAAVRDHSDHRENHALNGTSASRTPSTVDLVQDHVSADSPSANGTKRRGESIDDGRHEDPQKLQQDHQVKNSIRDLASSSSVSSSLRASNSPAKVRKLDHADTPSSSSRSSPSEALNNIHIEDSSSSPYPDIKDIEMAARAASPARSAASSDHRSTTSSSRREDRRSQSRDVDDSHRRRRHDSRERYDDRSSRHHGSSRSKRTPSPRPSSSSSSRRDERRRSIDRSRDRHYSDRGDYDRERSSRSTRDRDYRSSHHPIMTSGRRYDDRSDKSFEQELERYSRERSHRREDSYSKSRDQEHSSEPRTRDGREASQQKSDKPSSHARSGSTSKVADVKAPVRVDSPALKTEKAPAVPEKKPEVKREEPKTEEPEVDIPIVLEEEKDEAALLEERRKKRQELLDRLKKTEKPSTPAPSTPTTPAAASTPLPSTPKEEVPTSASTTTTTTASNISVDPMLGQDLTPDPSEESQPGTPMEDRPTHRALSLTKKSASDMALLKLKDRSEHFTNDDDAEQEVSAADYEEAAPSLPETIQKKPAKDPGEIDMFGDLDDDMFNLDADALAPKKPAAAVTTSDYNPMLVDNWDDAEGYYRFGPGEMLDDRYMVTSILGKGVFSSVVKAVDKKGERDAEGKETDVAIKILRNNETMYKAGKKELDILQRLMDNDPHNRKHVIRLLRHFEHRGHLCLVFESLAMNLRDVLKQFGKDVGLNINAVRIYAQQLFLALSLLKKSDILHADIKPDNILVNKSKNVLKLCDLGSASDTSENEITPYLVSRFYRAPEIILGMPYDPALDMWSIACTLFELFTGKFLFPGKTNNQMLKMMMDLKGPFSKKMIRKGEFYLNHFDEDCNFLSVEVEKVTKKDVIRKIQITKPTKDLKSRLMPYTMSMSPVDVIQVNHFINLLDRCLHLNPEHRITPLEALAHPFIKQAK
ncbi:U4/U6 small nuclear ribonucleoprotein prp4 [Gryganskiella cystojenkinii]|nr:U4/U6 small nuclear ribonucleoprotein prp4 [Gryganskiella cystojenkinii]